MPGKNYTFTTRVDPKSPPCAIPTRVKIGGGAGLRPRVRNAYFAAAFIAIAGKPAPHI